MVQLLRLATDHDDIELAYQLARDLYMLTGDEEFADIAKRLDAQE